MISALEAHGFSTIELAKFNESVALANEIIASDEFSNAVMAATFTSTIRSNATILEVLRKDCAPSFLIRDATLKERLFRTMAIDGNGWNITFIRTQFAKEDLADLAGTIAHEVCHGWGFKHISAKELSSVPYQIGIIVVRLARLRMASKNQVQEHLSAVESTNS